MHGYFGPFEGGVEVQRRIKRADMRALWVALRGLCAPATIHTDSMGILNGLHREEKMCIAPRAEEADLWIGLWEGVEEVRDRDVRLDVMHVKADRTQKEKAKMTLFEKFAVEGNEATDWVAKDGEDLDGSAMVTIRAATVRQGRMEVNAALQFVATCHCHVSHWHDCDEPKPYRREKWTIVDAKKEKS